MVKILTCTIEISNFVKKNTFFNANLNKSLIFIIKSLYTINLWNLSSSILQLNLKNIHLIVFNKKLTTTNKVNAWDVGVVIGNADTLQWARFSREHAWTYLPHFSCLFASVTFLLIKIKTDALLKVKLILKL